MPLGSPAPTPQTVTFVDFDARRMKGSRPTAASGLPEEGSVSAIILAAAFVAATTGEQLPVQFFAEYQTISTSPEIFEVEITEQTMLYKSTVNEVLKRIVVRPRNDRATKEVAERTSFVAIHGTVGGRPIPPVVLNGAQLKDSKTPHPVLAEVELDAGIKNDDAAPVMLKVIERPSSDWLCTIEGSIRAREGLRAGCEGTGCAKDAKKAAVDASVGSFERLLAVWEKTQDPAVARKARIATSAAIVEDGTPIQFSFCIPSEFWSFEFAGLQPELDRLIKTKDQERERMVKKLTPSIRRFSAFGEVSNATLPEAVREKVQTGSHALPNVVTTDALSFSVKNASRRIVISEETLRTGLREAKPTDLGSVIDASSRIRVTVGGAESEHSSVLPTFLSKTHKVSITREAKGSDKTKVVVEQLRTLSPNSGVFDVDLNQFLNDRIEIKYIYTLGGKEFVLYRTSTTVRRLGFVVTFPAISELRGASKGYNAIDPEARSRIPVVAGYSLTTQKFDTLGFILPATIAFAPDTQPELAELMQLQIQFAYLFDGAGLALDEQLVNNFVGSSRPGLGLGFRVSFLNVGLLGTLNLKTSAIEPVVVVGATGTDAIELFRLLGLPF